LTNGKEQEIGVATIAYDEQGRVKNVEFTPTLTIDPTPLLPQFEHLSGNGDLSTLKKNADLVLGAWFENVDVIELADRERYIIDSETLSCSLHPDGTIRECRFKFVFRPVNKNGGEGH